MSVRIESVCTDAFSMDFFRFGRGERTLVILPGLSVQSVMGSADVVAAAYQDMGEAFTIYVFDRRKELPPVYTIHDMARDTAVAFRELGLKNVCLFGASQGGMIAQVLAIEYPELVGRMVLGSTSAHVLPEQFRTIERWIELAKRKDKEGLYLAFAKDIYPPEVFEKYKEPLLAAAAATTDEELERFVILAEGCRGFNVADELPKISCPVLAIGVFEDAVLDSDATMEIAEKMDFRDDFRLYMYVGFGHAAFDTAADYRQRLTKFFTARMEE